MYCGRRRKTRERSYCSIKEIDKEITCFVLRIDFINFRGTLILLLDAFIVVSNSWSFIFTIIYIHVLQIILPGKLETRLSRECICKKGFSLKFNRAGVSSRSRGL